MIEENTVLILGAGASYPFGYPLGADLKKNILELVNIDRHFLKSVEESNKNFQIVKPEYNISSGDKKELAEYLITKRHISSTKLITFFDNFRISSKPSIDTFLENRKEFLEIGKVLIAMSIIQCESFELLFTHEKQNWYNNLMKAVSQSCTWENLSDNKLSVITYNYDRSLETFLVTDLIHTYDKTVDECCRKIDETIPIKHVHGVIGEVPWKRNGYNKHYTSIDIDEAVNRLHIISEEDEVQKAYKGVHEILSGASRIFILGFGFDDRNLKRLDLLKHSKHAQIFATRTSLSDAEVNAINNKVGYSIIFSKHEEFGIVDFLRREVTLEGSVSYDTSQFNSYMRSRKSA